MSEPLTFGSLFAGIDGFDLGFERAGLVCKWQVEINEYCQRVLAKHWPAVRRHDDVRTFPPNDADDWRVDVICGGFPCQDISKAGNVQGARRGIEGDRSGLWSEFARIVGEIRPRIVVVENSPKLLDSGLGRILGDLAAIGFDAEWACIPAAAVGACHIRDRVFVCAYTHGERLRMRRCPAFARPPKAAQAETREWAGLRLDVRSMGEGSTTRARFIHERLSKSSATRTGNELSARVDRVRAIGNAVYPDVAEWIGRRIVEAYQQPY